MADLLTRELPYIRYAGQASHPLAADIGLVAGDYILHIDDSGNAFIIDSADVVTPLATGVGAAAPADSEYWVAAADGDLPNAHDLSGITGIVKSTAGVPSAAVAGTDYLTPSQVDVEAIVFAIALG